MDKSISKWLHYCLLKTHGGKSHSGPEEVFSSIVSAQRRLHPSFPASKKYVPGCQKLSAYHLQETTLQGSCAAPLKSSHFAWERADADFQGCSSFFHGPVESRNENQVFLVLCLYCGAWKRGVDNKEKESSDSIFDGQVIWHHPWLWPLKEQTSSESLCSGLVWMWDRGSERVSAGDGELNHLPLGSEL